MTGEPGGGENSSTHSFPFAALSSGSLVALCGQRQHQGALEHGGHATEGARGSGKVRRERGKEMGRAYLFLVVLENGFQEMLVLISHFLPFGT